MYRITGAFGVPVLSQGICDHCDHSCITGSQGFCDHCDYRGICEHRVTVITGV